MDGRNPFRFLQAGDFQLGLVPYGISDVPEEIREQLLDAPYQAVERVFAAALEYQVDFVLLVGELATSTTADGCIGPRAAMFLLQQFERLQVEGIGVYIDGETGWPEWCALPPNVYRVNRRSTAVVANTRSNQYAATIHTSVAGAPHERSDSRFDILAIGRDQISASIPTSIDFVAAVGSESAGQPAERASSPDSRIWCSGTPQGRHLNSGEQHGCLIVEVDERQDVNVQFVATAVVGWSVEHVTVSGSDDVESIAGRINSRAAEIARHSDQNCVLVDWVLNCQGVIDGRLICESTVEELHRQLQHSTNSAGARVHPVGVRVDETQPVSLQAKPERIVLSDFVQLTSAMQRYDDGQTELQQLPWLAGEFAASDHSLSSRVVRCGLDLLG